MTTLAPAICPPCTRDQHHACDTSAWCEAINFPTVCECYAAGHEEAS